MRDLRGRGELILALPDPAYVDVEVALAMLHTAESAVAVSAWQSGHLLLMRALAASGNVAEALAAYERLRIMLRDELGVDPSEGVQDAYTRLLG